VSHLQRGLGGQLQRIRPHLGGHTREIRGVRSRTIKDRVRQGSKGAHGEANMDCKESAVMSEWKGEDVTLRHEWHEQRTEVEMSEFVEDTRVL
jgi:hypothetical protein